MKSDQPGLSPNQKAIKRLLKNKPALFGLLIILVAIGMAVLGYLITPDHTPDANDQITEVALKPPGFISQVLKVRKNRSPDEGSWVRKMIGGEVNPYHQVPIQSFEIHADSIYVDIVSADSQSGVSLRKRYNIADVVFPISANKREIMRRGDQVSFYDINEELKVESLDNLKRKIEEEQIHSRKFWLGTDRFGRCMLSRLIIGVRVSLFVGLIAVLISLTIGVALGSIAGYYGGRTDDLIMLLINTVWSIPTLLLVFAIVLAFGRGVSIIFIAVGLTMWVDVARIVRGQVMALKKIQFVEAAQSMGFDGKRIITKHILPNILGPVMVIAAANFATAILLEAGLSYLGFGIQPPTPSWGNMLNENYGYAISGKPFLAFVPAIAIMLLVLAFNLLGNGFRDALDVKSK